MKQFITEIIFLVAVGLFLMFVWGIDPEKIGFIRWLIGWVICLTLLIDVWPSIKSRYFKN
jgi:hypothetical protein